MTVRVTAAERLLLGAADMLERRGLARGRLEDEDGCVCPVRAIQVQVFGPSFLVPWWEDKLAPIPTAYAEALRAIATHLGWPIWQSIHKLETDVMVWSDYLAADIAEVVTIFRAAAKLTTLFTADQL